MKCYIGLILFIIYSGILAQTHAAICCRDAWLKRMAWCFFLTFHWTLSVVLPIYLKDHEVLVDRMVYGGIEGGWIVNYAVLIIWAKTLFSSYLVFAAWGCDFKDNGMPMSEEYQLQMTDEMANRCRDERRAKSQ